ncbi:MAG: mechanosensitive ion channel [Elusimicrobia bacterium]|nr:mechanosensitive ion channel [Elusimicrobiota bacterium]
MVLPWSAAVLLGLVLSPASAGEQGEGGVRLGGVEVVRLRAGGPGGLSAAERGEVASKRLERALADPVVGPEHIRVEVRDGRPVVLAGRLALLTVGVEDADLEQSKPGLLAEHWAGLIREPFREAKSRHFSIRLLMRYLVAMTYPIAFLVAIAVLRRLQRRGLAAIYRLPAKGPSPARLFGVELASRQAFIGALAGAVRGAVIVASVAAVYLFLLATFYHFPATHTLGLRMRDALAGALSAIAQAAVGQLGWILSVGVALAVAYALLKVLDRFFDAIDAGTIKLTPYITQDNADTVETLANGLVYLLLAGTIVLLLPGEGSRLGLGALAFLGLAVSLSSTPILRQFLAGLGLAFLKSHRYGSRVLWQGREATVLRRRLFHTSLRLRDGRRCLAPNHEVLASAVVPAEGAQESLSFDVRLETRGPASDALLDELSVWANELGDASGLRLRAVEDSRLRFTLSVPAMIATDDQFVRVAYGQLRDLAVRHHAGLVDFRPDS